MENFDLQIIETRNKIINQLKESVEEVIPMFFMCSADIMEDFKDVSNPLYGDRFTVNISIMGDLSGSIFLTMSLDVAKKIASTMTMQDFITELDAFHESALREMLNMISGTFSGKVSSILNPYSNEVYGIDISLPISIITTSDIAIWVDNPAFIKEIVFNIDSIGTITLYLALKGI